jgi:DNA-binding transcriptional regulator YiaG
MTPEEIRLLRESLGMTQEELAHRLGLETRGAVSHWEAGRKSPTGPALAALRMLAQKKSKKSAK